MSWIFSLVLCFFNLNYRCMLRCASASAPATGRSGYGNYGGGSGGGSYGGGNNYGGGHDRVTVLGCGLQSGWGNSMDSKRLHRIITPFLLPGKFPWYSRQMTDFQRKFPRRWLLPKTTLYSFLLSSCLNLSALEKMHHLGGWWGDFQGQAAKNFIWLLWQWWNTRSWNGRCVWFGKKKVHFDHKQHILLKCIDKPFETWNANHKCKRSRDKNTTCNPTYI